MIPDSQITASSYLQNNSDHAKGFMWRSRLDNFESPWCAGSNDEQQWLQYEFKTERLVTQVLTRGRHDCCEHWVNELNLTYRRAGDDNGWQVYSKILVGNADRNTLRVNV